jgi:transposase
MRTKLSDYRAYPSDVSDDAWEFCLPYLALMSEDAPQREYPLRAVLNGLLYLVRTGCHWRMLPTNLPPWQAVYQQARRWYLAGSFEAMVHDLRAIIRAANGKEPCPTAVIADSRTLQSTPESGHRAGYDGAKRKKGSKMHVLVDTLGNLLAARVTPANEQDREQARPLVAQAQKVTGRSIKICFADQGYTGPKTEAAVARQGVRLVIIKLPEAKRGFVLLPRRWVVERSFAWLARFRRLARDYERVDTTLKGIHWVATSTIMLQQVFRLCESQ